MAASATKKTPSSKSSRRSAAACSARRVLPVPPGPVRVRRRTSWLDSVCNLRDLALPAHKGGGLQGQVVGAALQRPKRRELGGQIGCLSWKTLSGLKRSLRRCSPRSPRAAPAGSWSRTISWVGSESSTCPPWAAESSAHAVYRRAEVVAITLLGRTRVQRHPHPHGCSLPLLVKQRR